MSSCTQADSFFYEWLNILEEMFDFSPFLLYLPSIAPRKIYTQDGSLGEAVNPFLDTKIGYDDFVGGLYLYPFMKHEPYNLLAVPSELKQHSLFDGFLHSLPLIVKQVNQLDQLTRKLKIARLELSLNKICDSKNSYNIADGLEEIRGYFNNEWLFVYSVSADQLIYAKDSEEPDLNVRRALMDACRKANYDRNMVTHDDFGQKIRSLMLYPIYSDEDQDAFLGSYSRQTSGLSTSDLNLICEIGSNIQSVSWILSELKVINKY